MKTAIVFILCYGIDALNLLGNGDPLHQPLCEGDEGSRFAIANAIDTLLVASTSNGDVYKYLHIEKTGTGVNAMYSKALCTVLNVSQGDVRCNIPGYFQDQVPKIERVTRLMTTVRLPYNHVRSNFRMGTTIKSTASSRYTGDMTFEEWIRKIQAGCNVRAFIEPRNAFHFYLSRERDRYGNPNLGSTIDMISHTLYHVGVTELMHESACVLYGKFAIEFNVKDAMPTGCDCTQKEEWDAFPVSHSIKQNHTEDQLTPRNKKIIDYFTDVDQQLFQAALSRLEKESRMVYAKLKVQIFCGDKLLKLREER